MKCKGYHFYRQCSDRPFSRASDCFERGLMNAITDQFPLVKIDGWLFHWTQALWRKMIEQRIPLNPITGALAPGVIDVLTIIPVDQIANKRIRRVDETGSKTKWDAIWS
ncbi:hypothetical protein L917_03456 [Phytophthora nicotianae]|uniref:Uncharacterized protein n=1 Tax=Phytophthora nicotianae TaxID=4792 RepID=W2LQQ6_PHYNI|nr:hypothetical protein L917_03456 [Phytophthora nicotianae]